MLTIDQFKVKPNPETQQSTVRVGFVCFGEINSPRPKIEESYRRALAQVASLPVDIVTTAPVTDDAESADVKRAIADLNESPFDALIVCLTGWIPSHAVISVTSAFKNRPMVLWGLAGEVVDGRIVTLAAQAGTTALRKVFADLSYKFRYLYDVIGQEPPLAAIYSFALAAAATRTLENRKVGMVGFRDMRLYNTLYEGLSLKATLGIDVEFFEMLELLNASRAVDEEEVTAVLERILKDWHFVQSVDEGFLRQGIRYYLALKQMVETHGLQAISLKDVDGMKKLLNFPPAMIFMLLSDDANRCTIPENDVMGAVTQLVVRHVTGQCAAYVEYYEFFENGVLVGVPDYVPAEVVDGPVSVTRAAFGGISGGLLNVSAMKTGRVTLVRLSNTADKYTLHLATGTATRRAWEEAGWDQPAPQLPSLQVDLDVPMQAFVPHISGQHYIVAYGDHRQALTDFCYLKNIQVV